MRKVSRSSSAYAVALKANNRKVSKTRRQRGYFWEDTIVKRFNGAEKWNAFRLGSPSSHLPDILAVNTSASSMYTIEAKSGTVASLPVPADQIETCRYWNSVFDIYKDRKVILAFKFLAKKRIDVGEYKSRELREFFKIWDDSMEPANCACTYEGDVYLLEDTGRVEIDLKDCSMPFMIKSKGRRA